MATAETVKTLQEIQELLDRLDGRAPGSPLRADDWNGLVDAVSRLTRLGIVIEDEEPPEIDVEAGSVRFEHLSDEVRKLLEAGPYGDTRNRFKQLGLEKRLAAIEAQLGGQSGRLDGLLGAVGSAETSMLRGLNDVKALGHRVDGLATLDQEVGDVRTILNSVRDDLQSALTLADDLDGLEVGVLLERVDALDTFRRSWLDENENPVGLDGMLRRLEEVESSAIDDTRLSAAIDGRLATFDVDPDAITAAVTGTMRTELEAATAALSADIDRRITDQTATLNGLVDDAVSREVEVSLGDLDDRIASIAAERAVEAASGLIDDRLGELRNELTVDVDQRLERLSADVDQRMGTIQRDLNDRMDRFEQDRPNRFELERLLTEADQRHGVRFEDLDGRLTTEAGTRAEADVTLRRERAEAVTQANNRTDAILADSVRREAAERTAAIKASVEAAVRNLRSEIGGVQGGVDQAARDAAVAAVAQRFEQARTELERRMLVIVKDATTALENDIDQLQKRIDRTPFERRQPGGGLGGRFDGDPGGGR